MLSDRRINTQSLSQNLPIYLPNGPHAMTSFKTTAYIETTETQLQGVVDAIMGKDLSAWVCDYPFGTDGPEIIALEGNLGAGKTTLTKALCAAWGCEQDVSSPTFSLVNEHTIPNFN